MLKPGLIMVIAMWAIPGPCAASFFHQNEPETSLEASEGFNIGGTDYFLLKLRFYYRAKGIAAFPDGGRPKTAFESVYLFKAEKDGPRKAAELGAEPGLSGSPFKTSALRGSPDGPLIKVCWLDTGRKGSEKAYRYYLYDPVSAAVTAIADPGGEWPRGSMDLTETNGFWRDFSGFDEAGLPNPLDHTPGTGEPSGLAKLISKGLGDRRLRLAAARRLIASGEAERLRSAIAALDKKAGARKLYFWAEEKVLLENILAGGGKDRGPVRSAGGPAPSEKDRN